MINNGKPLGKNVAVVESPNGQLIMGAGSYINAGTQIRALGADIVLGQRVGIGHNVLLVTSYGSHYLGQYAVERKKPIVVNDHAWIGHGAMIRGGVTIGRWAVVGMGAVVLDDVPDYMVAVGNPARVVGRRPDYNLVLARECSESLTP